jgi:hypothetical protein
MHLTKQFVRQPIVINSILMVLAKLVHKDTI